VTPPETSQGLRSSTNSTSPALAGAMTIKGSLLFSAIRKNGSHTTVCDGRLWSNGEGSIKFDLDDGTTATLTVASIVPTPPSELMVSGSGLWRVEQN
jgi:hypothetical protein